MEKYLRKCLDSLIVSDDNMKQLEVLVINDGSKDSSSLIAHEYENKFPDSIKVIDKQNGNYGSCINTGLPIASGKYIKVLDADDYFVKEALESVLVFLGNTDADLIITPYYMVDEHNSIIKSIKFELPESIMNCDNKIIEKTLSSKYFQMHAVMYKKNIFEKLPYHQSEGISYTDQEWMFSPFTKVKTITLFNSYLYCYLIGRSGQTVDKKIVAKNVNHHIKGSLKMLNEYTKFDIPDGVIKRYLSHRLNCRISDVFKIFLLNNLSQQELVEFDKKIKEIDCSYYNDMNNITLHNYYPYHFIREWREGKIPSFRFHLYKFIKNTF